jgi:hypothetical protein
MDQSLMCMEASETFRAFGHPNIRSRHRTTLMTTREAELTKRGDCIIAVRAEKGLSDLDPQLKALIRNRGARITFTLEVDGIQFEIKGRGDPRLTHTHPHDIVIRKSSYTCDRTLMIMANKAACDIPESLVEKLKTQDRQVKITIAATL